MAKEGVNAQMAVPQNVLKNFQAACETLPLFKDLYLNTDHYMSAKEFQDSLPFKALHVRYFFAFYLFVYYSNYYMEIIFGAFIYYVSQYLNHL